jgi:PAS domain S-box-containing protein
MPEKQTVKSQGGTVHNQHKHLGRPQRREPQMGMRYRALVEQVPAVIYTDSAEVMYKTLYISPQLKTITGYTPKEWLEDDDLWTRSLYPEDRERVIEEYDRTFNAMQPSLSEYRLVTRNGRVIWVSDETRLVRDRKGKPLFWQGVMMDITARKRSEQIQQAIYRISHAVVTTTSLEDLYKSIHAILGELMPVENLYIALYDPENDLLSFPYYIDQYDEPPQPARPQHGLTEYVLSNRQPLWAPGDVFTQLVLDGEADVVGTDSVDWIGVPLMVGSRVIGVMVTQTYTPGLVYNQEQFDLMQFVSTQVASAIERKMDQQRIADTLEYNQTLLDTSSLGITTYDASGRCILANESIARILGTTPEQLLSENYNQLETWEESGLLEKAHEATTSGAETRLEYKTTDGNGGEIWLDCRFTPFVANGVTHLLLSVDDITETKLAEMELQKYAARLEQSNRDLQEFAYIASHDLQEPLRKVLAFGDRLASKYGESMDVTGRDYLRRMREASLRMQTLINDLLTFSRVTTRAQPFIQVDLNALVGEVISDLEMQIDRTNAKVETGKLPTIEADPTQMHQLMQNLIHNGLKYHREGLPPDVQISASTARKHCRLMVKDNGIGFDMQYIDRIFKPFQRLHSRQEYEGSGMGLAICRRIVERHNGEITAESSPGNGATFIVSLPIVQPKGENSHA